MNQRFCSCGQMVKPDKVVTSDYHSLTLGFDVFQAKCRCGKIHTWKIEYWRKNNER
jgi:hypothetical protein